MPAAAKSLVVLAEDPGAKEPKPFVHSPLHDLSPSPAFRTRDADGDGAITANTACMETGALRCRRRFLRFFPSGFRDETYLDWERSYKVDAHDHWQESLDRSTFRALLRAGEFHEIATRTVQIESRTNLLFSFEKMALRDAVRGPQGARRFAEGLYDFLHGHGSAERRFTDWCATIAALPRRQTRVLTWPVVTVFGFIAQIDQHLFLKPNVTRTAAAQVRC